MTDTAPTADLLTVAQVCDRFPGKGGGRVHKATVTRWIISGCPARDGTRVRLSATRCGSRWVIAPADLDAFFRALAAAPTVQPTTAPTKPTADTADRTAAAKRAAELLAARGASTPRPHPSPDPTPKRKRAVRRHAPTRRKEIPMHVRLPVGTADRKHFAPTPCPHCGRWYRLYRWHPMRNGRRHVRATCADCGRFTGWAAQTAYVVAAADAEGGAA